MVWNCIEAPGMRKCGRMLGWCFNNSTCFPHPQTITENLMADESTNKTAAQPQRRRRKYLERVRIQNERTSAPRSCQTTSNSGGRKIALCMSLVITTSHLCARPEMIGEVLDVMVGNLPVRG
jgi:ABC-type polar amino acid transport system ATPase subunit